MTKGDCSFMGGMAMAAIAQILAYADGSKSAIFTALLSIGWFIRSAAQAFRED